MREYILKKRMYDFNKETAEKEIEEIAQSIMKKSKEPIACIHTDYMYNPCDFEIKYKIKIETLSDLERKYNEEGKR